MPIDETRLIISISDDLGDDVVSLLRQHMSEARVPVQIDKHDGGPQNSLWLYVPTLVVIFFAKPFLESIAKKAGEDAYPHLKKALANAVKSLSAVKIFVVGKQPDEVAQQFSLVASFYFKVNEQCRVKFLVRKDVSEQQHERSVDQMCDLLFRYVTSEGNELANLIAAAPRKSLVLLDFNFVADKWELLAVPLGPPR